MSTYRLSEQAESDLRMISKQTIKRWGKVQAKKYIQEVHNVLITLANEPTLGREREEIFHNARSFPVGKHIIFYRQTRLGIAVSRVLHQHMELMGKFT